MIFRANSSSLSKLYVLRMRERNDRYVIQECNRSVTGSKTGHDRNKKIKKWRVNLVMA